LSNSTLSSYYKTVLALVEDHGWSIADINDLVPFERDLYVDMLNARRGATDGGSQEQHPTSLDMKAVSNDDMADLMRVAALNKRRMIEARGGEGDRERDKSSG